MPFRLTYAIANERFLEERPASSSGYSWPLCKAIHTGLTAAAQPFRKWFGRVKLRIDDHLALFVDVAPLASALITNPHCREAIRKMESGIKLRLDDNTPGLFGDLCDGSMSVRRPDEEDSRVVNGFANDHHESSTAPG